VVPDGSVAWPWERSPRTHDKPGVVIILFPVGPKSMLWSEDRRGCRLRGRGTLRTCKG
jgi:hypothetical protein